MSLRQKLSLLILAIATPYNLFAQNFREGFRESPAHIPATSTDLTSPHLTLERLGPGADKLKLSHHPEIKNDPHYLWNGLCSGPILIGFRLKDSLDLSDPNWAIVARTKNVGNSRLHLAIQIDQRWFASEEPFKNLAGWNTQKISFHDRSWRELSSDTVKIGKPVKAPDLSKITALGFAAPVKPKKSKSCIRLDWFELISENPKGQFLEPETPFLRSALLIKNGGVIDPVRRGVLIPIGQQHWACFDPDLLRWAAIWGVPNGKTPLTYDSMAAISYPEGTTKAKKPPSLRGKLMFQAPKLPGAAEGALSDNDPRRSLMHGGNSKVGPLPITAGRWLGLSLWGTTPVLHYLIGKTTIAETISSNNSSNFERKFKIAPHSKPLQFHVGKAFKEVKGQGTSLKGGVLTITPSASPQVVSVATKAVSSLEFPEKKPAVFPFPKTFITENPTANPTGPFTIRPVTIPENDRAIRPTDIAFLSNGTGLLATLDGDVWRIEDIENTESPNTRWTRIATGLFETISIETSNTDQIYILGRDQITELIDLNDDGFIDQYRNASDAFQQTLQTRDYATSLSLQADGSFLVAKGGINQNSAKVDNELSLHRGSIIKISPDGNTVTNLADGLRLPFIGLRADEAVFASDQQGNHIPSTPIHMIGNPSPFLGYPPTNHRKQKARTEPLLWFPYQANRSGAAFATTTAKGFPELGGAFLQISWGGRLFAIATPETGQAFSWQLPLQLDFPSLNAASHPKSGRLYVTGLGISGYKPTTPNISGLASVEESSTLPHPTSIDVRAKEIEIVFNRPLEESESVLPGKPALRLFNIKRTSKYGSGHFRWDDKPGEHRFQPKSLTFSNDRRTLLLTFDNLFRSDILDLSLNVTSNSKHFPIHLFSRPAHLTIADQESLKHLTKREKNTASLKPGDINRGKLYYTQFACAGCHSLDSTKLVGPSLQGLANRADQAAIKQSILDPNAVLTKGYPAAMPPFAGVLSEQELADLLAYLSTLK